MRSTGYAGQARRSRGRPAIAREAAPFVVLTVFAATVFLLGGASRPDILPPLMLRPLSVAVCGWALLTMPAGTGARHRGLWWFVAAVPFLVALQLVPLPPGVWQSLPGRALLVEADRLAGFGPLWRPVSLTPDLTWNALFALATPVAALLMVLALPPRWSQRLYWVLVGAGLASGLLGVFQIVGIVDDSLSYYQASGNAHTAVGLFANRNHAAVFLACLMPVLAAFAMDGGRHRQIVAVTTVMILVPLIVATGSRAGVLLGGIGMLLAVLLLLHERRRRAPGAGRSSRRWVSIALVAPAVLLVTLVVRAVPTAAWDRLLSSGSAGEKRLRAWPEVVRLAREQMPLGSGYGSFDPVFRADEPMALLSPTYFNHAHNDWLELWLTGGIPALAMLAVGVAMWAVASWRVWAGGRSGSRVRRREHRLARAGSAVLLMLALASLVDYPLRTPSLSMFAAIAAGWLAVGQRRETEWNGESPRPDDAGRAIRESDA